jgi:phenylacetate-CoA ligase
MADAFSIALRRFVFSLQPQAPDFSELQSKHVRALLQHAVKHVPLYRELYRRYKIDIDTIERADDLWRLPAVSKPDYIRAGVKGYIDERILRGDLYAHNTSGSIGAAMTMYATQYEASFHLAGLWSAWIGAGVNVKDRLFMMSARYLADKVAPFNSVFVPVDMSIDEIVERFQTFRPTVVIGLMESIALLAVELRRRNISERNGVRSLFVFGQMYSEQLRRMVQSGFDAETFILYGSTETGWMAYECERHDGLHLMTNRVVVQIARTGKPDEPMPTGESGELIITSLTRSTTPFIRYRLHDAAAIDFSPCPCGRVAPRLTNLEGRVQDFLIASDGRWVSPSLVQLDLIIGRPDILDYRIVQSSPEHVHVSLVLALGLDAAGRQRIEQIVRHRLGAAKIDIDLVDEIPREASGKRRRVYRTFDLPESA